MKKITLSILILFFGLSSIGQTLLKGKVVNENQLPLPGVNITIQGSTIKTITDFEGQFSIVPIKKKPIILEARYYGYQVASKEFISSDSNITLVLKKANRLDELIISASRIEESIFESPVSVERFGTKEIKNTPSADFYEGLQSLKGIDINTNSFTNKSINARGVTSFTNSRFVQLVDGVDNSSPTLNFVMGNLLGLSELDVHSIEILPGASSALYGANAFNGILFMRSKNPFDFQGISAYAKAGVSSQEIAGTNHFFDYGVRLAKAFSKKLAVKANITYLKATEWKANNTTNINFDENNPNSRPDRSDSNYNGVNVYGDDFNAIIFDRKVSRTGYNEIDITDLDPESLKLDASIHYRPFENDFEIIYNPKFGQGSTIFGSTSRVSVEDFKFFQNKLEIKNDNFFVRGYITLEDAQTSYDHTLTAIRLNQTAKSDLDWYTDYGTGLAGALSTALNPLSPTASELDAAHAFARSVADNNRLIPGTPQFEQALREVRDRDLVSGGARYKNDSQLRHVDANYNFSHLTKDIADIQVGGSFRQYKLDTGGTYTDLDGPIKYSEFGIYTQIQKKLADDRIKLTGSVRYDKSELFDGNFSPRFSVGYTLGRERNHNIRASFQTAFRNPTTQNLYLGLNLGGTILAGSANDNLNETVRVLRASDQQLIDVELRQAYENSFTAESFNEITDQLALGQAIDFNDLKIANPDPVQPEQVQSYELGYRSKISSFIIDISGYYSKYTDFITTQAVVTPLHGNVNNFDATNYDINDPATLALVNQDTQDIITRSYPNDILFFTTNTNSEGAINSFGATVGVETKIFKDFDLGANYTFADQDFDGNESDANTSFNTPKNKVKLSFGHEKLFENFGFNTNARWSDSFIWKSPIGDGNIPAYWVVDAQVNYTIPDTKILLKAGATNIGGNEYNPGFGSGLIGSTYYFGLTFNNL